MDRNIQIDVGSRVSVVAASDLSPIGRILSSGLFSNETGTLQRISVVSMALQLSYVQPKFLNETSRRAMVDRGDFAAWISLLLVTIETPMEWALLSVFGQLIR